MNESWRDEFKDYPESALYMIGKVDEAKDKAQATKASAKPDADSKTKGEPDIPPQTAANPQPEAGHATVTHAS